MTKDSATTQEDYRYENGSHRLAAVTTTDASGTTERTFSHDANGNTTSDASNDRVLQLAFNARNRLAEVTQDGNVVGQYEYNALGQRVAKTSTYRGRLHAHLDQGNKPATNNGKGNANAASQSNVHATTDNAPVTEHLQFVYDEHGNLIAESDGEGNVMREYIYLGNTRIAMTASTLDHPEVTPAGLGAAQGPKAGTLALYFIHTDHLGTPKVVTDQSQNIVWSMHQTPFGETTLDTEAIRMPMRFPGQYADIESGYRYNYFRDYDPTLGRYVESDPIGLMGGLSTMVYVGANPMVWMDPSGLGGKKGVIGDKFERPGPVDQSGRPPMSGEPIGPNEAAKPGKAEQLLTRILSKLLGKLTGRAVKIDPITQTVRPNLVGAIVTVIIAEPFGCGELDCDGDGYVDNTKIPMPVSGSDTYVVDFNGRLKVVPTGSKNPCE